MSAPEGRLLRQVLDLAAMTGWKAFHVENATREITRRSGARIRVRNVNPQGVGFPDLVLVRIPTHSAPGRIFFRELKDTGKYPTPEQRDWMAAVLAAGGDYEVWRPQDWPRIEAEMTRGIA